MKSTSYFSIVSEVTRTWYRVKKIPNYKIVAGRILFQNIIEIAGCGVLDMFSFSKAYNQDVLCDIESIQKILFTDPLFEMHCNKLITMMDLTIQLLGPELDIVERELILLGGKHVEYNVKPEHYPVVGQALIQTLEMALGPKNFTSKSKHAWEAIYKFMSTYMIAGAYEAQSF